MHSHLCSRPAGDRNHFSHSEDKLIGREGTDNFGKLEHLKEKLLVLRPNTKLRQTGNQYLEVMEKGNPESGESKLNHVHFNVMPNFTASPLPTSSST